MQGAFRNKRKIWYANLIEREEILRDGRHTGQYRSVYTNPIPLWINRSTTSGLTNNNIAGRVEREMYGQQLDYNVTLNPIPDSCDMNEQSVLWIDTPPVIKEDGSTDTPFDHIITRISYSNGWRACQGAKVNREKVLG